MTLVVERDRPATCEALVTGRVQADEVHGAHVTGVEVDELTGVRRMVRCRLTGPIWARIVGGRFGRVAPARGE